ncbi:hypothetical protein MMC13_006977 [Lambiella insularis]|nr:hypothetical protein [Lambiella insularis]
MPRLNNDDQFKFLISCIRWSNNGKIDFTEVAKECSVVTKGAAAKRYERLMKAHGIHQPISSRDTAVEPLRPKGGPASNSSKKRKQDQFDTTNDVAADDDEGLVRVKTEKTCTIPKEKRIKTEAVQHTENSSESGYPWLRYESGGPNSGLADTSSAFNEFIVPESYESINPSQLFEDATTMQSSPLGGNGSLGGSDGTRESILIVD